MLLGARLRAARASRGLTLEQVQAATGISTPYLSKIERDRIAPPPETFLTIARTVELEPQTIEELLDELEFRRGCLDLERAGIEPAVARVAVGLSRLDDRKRETFLSDIESSIAEVFPPALN